MHEFDLVAADELIAAHTDASSFACKVGCSWCCHQLVVMTNHADGKSILDAARSRMTAAQFANFEATVRDQAARIAALPYEQAEAMRWPCPLLVDDRCSVYELRPVACRSVFSTDPECCRAMAEADDFAELTQAHQALATDIGERALALQIAVNDRRPIDRPIELRELLLRWLDDPAD
ncbi:MAG: YkgJ family cysteine cluster protein [Gammaproteobacteria bacterium]